jgi:hypothetical protein
MIGKQGFAEDYIPVNERIALFIAQYPQRFPQAPLARRALPGPRRRRDQVARVRRLRLPDP